MENPQTDFVHLHLHTQYSLLDGAIRLGPLFKRAKEYGMQSVAITDHGTMFGVLDFFLKAEKVGIRPIIGCEAYVAPRSLLDKRPDEARDMAHLVLLARNNEGYKSLCRLATIAQTKGFYYKPRIDDAVLAEHAEGLIALSACLKGAIPQLLLKGDLKRAEEKARFYEKIFGEGNFYLEIQENGLMPQREVNTLLSDLSQKLSIPLVATNDCHYLDAEDTRAHEILLCVQTGKTIDDPNRFHFETDALYFKSGEQMEKELGHYPGAIANTVEIAKRCEVSFELKTYHFPQFPSEEAGVPDSELFAQKAREGFEKRLSLIQKHNPDLDEKAYKDRLEYEIEMINQMGFPGYFLIVADFIQYSKSQGIPVGPGRGSAAGSMVAYAMGITDLDPIEHGLIFERFLNPARISMPDIDVDFCINGREKVYDYVSKKYGGGDHVAQIITFGKLKAKAVIRDVGRALGIPLRDVDAIAKLVPDTLNITLKEALEKEPELQNRANEREDIKELIDIAM
ncbi:DNA polymerase III subunit alpha, partial [Desulfococcaceae bacterium OttesenSCG-928-F15]|nr:DNA polymerase III subunit alpha [Desulfococcaceae bacterium OttesenSCG-928-F15]